LESNVNKLLPNIVLQQELVVNDLQFVAFIGKRKSPKEDKETKMLIFKYSI